MKCFFLPDGKVVSSEGSESRVRQSGHGQMIFSASLGGPFMKRNVFPIQDFICYTLLLNTEEIIQSK